MNIIFHLLNQGSVSEQLIKQWSARVSQQLANRYRWRQYSLAAFFCLFFLVACTVLCYGIWTAWVSHSNVESEHAQAFSAWAIAAYLTFIMFSMSMDYLCNYVKPFKQYESQRIPDPQLFPVEHRHGCFGAESFLKQAKRRLLKYFLIGCLFSVAIVPLFQKDTSLLHNLQWSAVGLLSYISLSGFLLLFLAITSFVRPICLVACGLYFMAMLMISVFVCFAENKRLDASWFFEDSPPFWFFRENGDLSLHWNEWLIQGSVVALSLLAGKFLLVPNLFQSKLIKKRVLQTQLTKQEAENKLRYLLDESNGNHCGHWLDRIHVFLGGKLQLSFETIVFKTSLFPSAKYILHLFGCVLIAIYCLNGAIFESNYYRFLMDLVAYLAIGYVIGLCFYFLYDSSFRRACSYYKTGVNRGANALALFPVDSNVYFQNLILQKILRLAVVSPILIGVTVLFMHGFGYSLWGSFLISLGLATITGVAFTIGEIWFTLHAGLLFSNNLANTFFMLWNLFLWSPLFWPFALFGMFSRAIEGEQYQDYSLFITVYIFVLCLTIWRIFLIQKKKVLTSVSIVHEEK